MKKTTASEIQRGQAITFRIPSDTPDHVLRQLQKLKETEKRNFSSKIAEYVLENVGNSTVQDREMIKVPLPHKLSKGQRDWLKHAHSEAMLGTILYHILSDPLRATSLLASLTSNALEIDEALYLQELPPVEDQEVEEDIHVRLPVSDAELDNFDWNDNAAIVEESSEEVKEESLDDLLGDFLAQMNK